jgi:preprotein translocase subunit YajC
VESLGALLPFLLIIGVFWLLILRPAQKRQREQAVTMAALVPGARVMTTAGMFGTVRALHGDTVELEVAPGVVLTYLKQAVAKVVPEPTGAAEDDGDGVGGGDAPGRDAGA